MLQCDVDYLPITSISYRITQERRSQNRSKIPGPTIFAHPVATPHHTHRMSESDPGLSAQHTVRKSFSPPINHRLWTRQTSRPHHARSSDNRECLLIDSQHQPSPTSAARLAPSLDSRNGPQKQCGTSRGSYAFVLHGRGIWNKTRGN
jgi:hypothetical protein